MSNNLCSSPFSFSYDHRFFCFTSPSNSLYAQFTSVPRLFRHRSFTPSSVKLSLSSSEPKTSLRFSKVSLQEDSITEETHNSNHSDPLNSYPPGERSSSSSKSYAWVNPESPRATRLRRNSYDSKYASLLKIAKSLNVCSPTQEDVYGLLANLGAEVIEQDAVVVLNNLSNAETAPIALKYFLERLKFAKEVILYNVTLKVFRKCKDINGAEKLFDEMLHRGIKPDNVTFSTIISCARLCSLPHKSVEWFEKMPSFELEPDEITLSVMVDAYGKIGNVETALSLYDRARTEKWNLDAVTFCTLIRIYGMAGNFDGCLNVYEEMKALDVKPNVVLYNSLLDAMGRAKRPWQAKKIHNEMINNGFTPSWGTFAALLRAFTRARYGQDALNVYREMKEKEMEFNAVLFNSLLSMCADLGLIDEAVEIFEDMKSSDTCKPDSWTYSSLATVYSCSGKVSEAETTLNEMLEAGYEPNLYVLTSLIQCYGKANRTDDVVRTFDRLGELGITPDERFCGCLLNVMTQTPKEEVSKIIECIEKANPKVGYVVKLLVDGEHTEDGQFKKEAGKLLDSIGVEVRKAYCNCLIDLCVNLNQMERACELLDLGLTLKIYTDIQSKSPTQWSLNLKSLSLGAAMTALHVWINDLSKAFENGEELPSLLGINTGHGKHKYSDKGLAGVFELHLKELHAPFHEAPEKVGWFLTTKVAAKSWLESRRTRDLVAA